jgi:Uma2 family endonuclease
MSQPDTFLLIRPEHGGQAKLDTDGYVEGAPELIAEVAASSASYDLHVKMNVYRRSGVKEYIVWRTYDAAIDFFMLVEGRYDPAPLEEGVFKSRVFPGLWIDSQSLLKGDLAAALQTVQKGLANSAHADFVAHLQQP